ncbi:DNA alkylation repair protein [Pseudarthrobacter sp. N5]|uniref:DNA alkylation repair protein n=1 Tax=Pseudarthrobacter sp. N5 TaxID=3418416 RepID=UPI003CF6D997
MSDAGEFIDTALQREGDWYRAQQAQGEAGSALRFYGSSVGAVRGTVRDAGRRYPRLTHDQITALGSELWAIPVFERRLAAVVLLQSNVRLLKNSDLTRIEGFVRDARLRALVDPLAVDVIGPMIEALQGRGLVRAEGVLDRWAGEADVWLRRAAVLYPLRALRAGTGDREGFIRRAASVLATDPGTGEDGTVVREAVSLVLRELAAAG